MSENIKCQNCGMDCPSGAAFCVGCGAALTTPEKKTFCTNCGAEMVEGATFCAACGTKTEGPIVKVCARCGSDMQADQDFCVVCGQKVGVAVDPNTANQINQYNASVAPQKSSKRWVIFLVLGLVALLVTVGAYVGIREIGKNNLQQNLMANDWYTYKENLKVMLDFTEDEIKYDAYSAYLGTVRIGTLNYEVVDSETILVNGKEITVEIDEVDETVTFYPSFVDSSSFSVWLVD